MTYIKINIKGVCMAIIEGTKDNFNEEIKKGKVLVDFYAEWCGPCKILSPLLEQISEELTDLNIVKVDVDNEQEIAMENGVLAMPTMILFKDGIKVDQKVGVMEKEDLKNWIESK